VRRLLLCLAAALPLVMTVACGQKGPLYLPPKNGTVVTRPATNPSSPQDTNKDKDKDKDNSQTPPK
jgi:predicted small lipoprotein YifL